eukprot:4920815-Lingulodinium_polyedra.AAC.1
MARGALTLLPFLRAWSVRGNSSTNGTHTFRIMAPSSADQNRARVARAASALRRRCRGYRRRPGMIYDGPTQTSRSPWGAPGPGETTPKKRKPQRPTVGVLSEDHLALEVARGTEPPADQTGPSP